MYNIIFIRAKEPGKLRLNEGFFGSYKDKTSKEQSIANIKKDTIKIINDDFKGKFMELLKHYYPYNRYNTHVSKYDSSNNIIDADWPRIKGFSEKINSILNNLDGIHKYYHGLRVAFVLTNKNIIHEDAVKISKFPFEVDVKGTDVNLSILVMPKETNIVFNVNNTNIIWPQKYFAMILKHIKYLPGMKALFKEYNMPIDNMQIKYKFVPIPDIKFAGEDDDIFIHFPEEASNNVQSFKDYINTLHTFLDMFDNKEVVTKCMHRTKYSAALDKMMKTGYNSIKESAFGSYKGKTSKEDKAEKLKKETVSIIEKSIRDGFLKRVKPYVEEKYQEILYNIDPWYVNDTLKLGFVEDPKEIGLELKDSNNPRIDYELIVKIPVIHLEKVDLSVKPVPRDRRELQDCLPGVMNTIYNYFQYADKINNCYKEYFSEIYPDKEHYTLHLIPTLHLLNHEIENYAISGLSSIESLKHVKEFFFDWFDNYQIRCKKFTLQCERLKFEDCELLSEIFDNHIMCDQIILYKCSASELKSIKGLEKILSFEKLPNRNYHIDIRFISSFATKPGIGLEPYEQPCSEELVRDVTGKSYDDNIFEHRIVSTYDPEDWTKEDLINYQVSHTKMTMITFNIDRNGVPIKGEYEVGVGSSVF